MNNIPSLQELRDWTNQRVLNQTELVDTVTSCLYRHLLRRLAFSHNIHIQHNSNLLLIGETGSGKTYCVREIATKLDIPIIEINAKSISQEGWEGKSFIKLIEQQLHDFDYSRFKKSPIIFIDEFDKLCMPLGSSNNDNYNDHLQASLLKYIEGMQVIIHGMQLNTSDFCFIFAGAFTGLFKEEKEEIGFKVTDNKTETNITDRLINWGMLPELAGRIYNVVRTKSLTREMYKDILLSDTTDLHKWRQLFNRLGLDHWIELNYSEILTEAEERKLGVRGLLQAIDPYINKLLEMNLDYIDINDLEEYKTINLNTINSLNKPNI